MKNVLLVVLLLLAVSGSLVAADELVIEDFKGRQIAVHPPAEVIISLSPSNTEILFALGLGDRVYGVTSFCNFPLEAGEKQVVGGFADPNLELILSLAPDLVLTSDMHEETVQRLDERDIAALVVDPRSVEETYAAILMIGQAAGAVDEAEALIASMQGRIGVIQDGLAAVDEANRVRVYYELWHDPLMSAGRKSFIHDILVLAGGANIFADVNEGYPMVSSEAVVVRNPQVIVYQSSHGTAAMQQEQFTERSGWGRVAAVIDGRVYGVDPDPFNRSGPRLVDAVETAAALLYPEIFE